MPRRTGNAASTKSVELAKQDQLEFDDPDVVDEEEEVEYEEIEEEVEYEEVEDDDDDDEEEEEEEEEEVKEKEEDEEEEDDDDEEDEDEDEAEEEDEEIEGVCEVDANHDSKMVDDDPKDENEKEKHAKLLALPPHGAEVYVGGLPSDVSSEDLKQLFESVGEVVEVRMPGKGDNKTYAFINFKTKEMALKAIQKLSNKNLKGKKIKVSSSQAKNRLFIGNVPRDWTPDDFKTAVEEVGPGVSKVDLMKACAEYAKQKMSTPEFKLDTNAPTVSWADPKNASEATSTAQVKSLYVKNLPKTVTQEQLKKLFEHVGEITKVVIPPAKSGHENRYGFVHFKERSMAMKALKNTERYELDGQLLDCSLAKPPADKKDDTVSAPTAKGGPSLPRYAPLGYGLVGAYNPLGNGLAGAYKPLGNGLAGAYGVLSARAAQPMLYAPGASPGSTMIPMVLPDGRLVYVPQTAGQQPVRVTSPLSQQGGRRVGGGSSGGGSSSSGKRHRGDDRGSNSNNSRRGRHRPY